MLLAQDRPDQALKVLDRLRAPAVPQDRTGSVIEIQALRSVIEIQALRSLALAELGDEDGAVATLADTLTLAHPQGYVRVFVDEGPAMGALIGQLIRSHWAAVPGDYIGRLVWALEHDMAERASDEQPTPAAVPGLVTALSDRELELLHLLAAGKPSQDIADELHMALNTVKKHASASSRSSAQPTAPRRPPAPANTACWPDERPPTHPPSGDDRDSVDPYRPSQDNRKDASDGDHGITGCEAPRLHASTSKQVSGGDRS